MLVANQVNPSRTYWIKFSEWFRCSHSGTFLRSHEALIAGKIFGSPELAYFK